VIKHDEGAESAIVVPETEGEAASEHLCAFLTAAIGKRDYPDVADYAAELLAGGYKDLDDTKSVCFISRDKDLRTSLFDAIKERAIASKRGDRELQLSVVDSISACTAGDAGVAIGPKGAYLFRIRADKIIRVVLESEEKAPKRVVPWAIDTVMPYGPIN
jgi:hypothetical protein